MELSAQERAYKDKINSILIDKTDLREFFTYLKKDKSFSTIHAYLVQINTFKNTMAVNGDGLIKEKVFIEYYTNIEGDAKLSRSYKVQVYSALKQYAEFLVIKHRMSRNPMLYVQCVKNASDGVDRRPESLCVDEIVTMLSSIKKIIHDENLNPVERAWAIRDYVIVYLILTTGMKAKTIINLNFDNVFLEDMFIWTSFPGEKNAFEITEGLHGYIEIWSKLREKVKTREKNENAYFVTKYGERLSNSSVTKIVKNYAANLSSQMKVTPQLLRNTFSSLLYSATGDLRFVQEALGVKITAPEKAASNEIINTYITPARIMEAIIDGDVIL